MKVKLPFITKDQMENGRRVFEYTDKEISVDNTLNAQMRWESRFPELAEHASIVDYSTRIKEVGGTSLAVYPAAGLIDYYRGHKLILVNRTPTPRDAEADLVVQGSIGEIFAQLS